MLAITLPLSALGENIYVAQDAKGDGTGSDAANARSLTWLNKATNWATGESKVSAGDTVRFSGTLTNILTVHGSGSNGSPITLFFEPGSKFSAPVIASGSGFINLKSNGWITIDGGTNGLIECTENGTDLANQVSVYGIRATSSIEHVTVQNLTITNLYKRTPFSTTDANRFGVGISLQGSGILVTNCILKGGDTMLSISWSTGVRSNVTLIANTIGQCNHGITIGNFTKNAFLNNLTIANNRIDDLDVWDGHSSIHLDGIIVFNNASDYSGCISNFFIYGNQIGPNIGKINTAGIYIEVSRPPQLDNLRIYNNLFIAASPYSWNNGHLAVAAATNSIIANNTFASSDSHGIGIGFGYGQIKILNNLFYSIRQPISVGAASIWPELESNYNVFYDLKWVGTGAFSFPNYASASWTHWTGRGFEKHSLTNQPILDSQLRLKAIDKVARGKGTNLSGYFTTDKQGNTRPADGAWDIGAFQFVPSDIAAPAKLRIEP